MAVPFVFLGTCAADFSPRLKTDLAGRFDLDVRRASCALLDGRYLIDCGPHCPESFRIAGEDKSQITDIFITHTHPDHFLPESVAWVASDHPVRLWVRQDAQIPAIANVTVMRMEQFAFYDVDERLRVCGVPANHDERVFPRHLVFEIRGKKLYYGLDGGWMINGAYNFLKKAHFDMMVLDATCGDYEGDFRMAEHNSLPMIRLMLPSLRTVEILDDHTAVYLSHLAPSLHASHEETCAIAEKMGVHVAFDGLRTRIP